MADNNQPKENKFNFSDEEKQKEVVQEKKEAVKQDAQGLFNSTKQFIKNIFDFRDDTDRDATINAIKNDIPLKGATAWILIFAIFVASIGLNLSSTAVVIGAMLISPLMGPILGVGMSLAINDIDTLRSSFVNLLVMVVLSVLTAYLYFKISPLTELTPELESRTSPNILDVFIAIFGGLALIVARTKKGTIASVIFGVAIATALMPPLCTAGYGLAVDNWSYFFGAMYLFAINTTFIALATFLVLKILRFPMLKYANSKKRKRTAQFAAFFGIVAMIPAIMTFITLLQQTAIDNDYKNYLKYEVKSVKGLWLERAPKEDEEKTITLHFNDEIDETTASIFRSKIKNYESIKDYEVIVDGDDSRSGEKLSLALDRAFDDLDEKDNVISGLQKQIGDLEESITNLNQQIEAKSTEQTVSFTNLSRDAKVRFNDLEYFGYSKVLESKDFINIDTVTVANVRWKVSLADSIVIVKEKELQQWLQKELTADTIIIKRN